MYKWDSTIMVIEMTKSGEIIRAIQYFEQSSILLYTSYIVSSYHFSMGKKGKAGRSFFSNLPLDLRSSLRSQTLLPLVPGQNINTLESKQDELDKSLGLGPGHDFLPTQPASPSSSVDEDESTMRLLPHRYLRVGCMRLWPNLRQVQRNEHWYEHMTRYWKRIQMISQ